MEQKTGGGGGGNDKQDESRSTARARAPGLCYGSEAMLDVVAEELELDGVAEGLP
jgi:hypothetical protein